MSIRTERVSGEIQKALASPLQRIAGELSAGFITVTEVRMSPDLQIARVYVSVFGGRKTPAEVLKYIDDVEAGRIRHHIAKTVRLRYVPQLKFFIDDSLDRAQRIEALLDSVKPFTEPPAEAADGNND
ncbi:MAG: 30S ribosome-binding factor RbfA [Ignavibacteria bacterium]|nr:30S ribosome-binding factor RbfA [Ignavibacteria bacterium]